MIALTMPVRHGGGYLTLTQITALFAEVRERSTPTCVGTTPANTLRRRKTTVHPHVRGDDVGETFSVSLYDGPPPRAWGRRWYMPAMSS